MADSTRILDYPEVTTLDDDHNFSIDLLDVPTDSVSYSQLSSIVSKDINDASNCRLVQDFIDSTKETYKITSVLYSEKGITTELYDGYIVRINQQTTTLIPNMWQALDNNTEGNIRIKLSFNNTDYLPLYNGTAYDKHGLIGLDRNTLWGGYMEFKYNSSLNAWLVYKYPESYQFHYYPVYPSFAGIIPCVLKESDEITFGDDRKLMASIVGHKLPLINSVTLTKFGDETIINTRANGQVAGDGLVDVTVTGDKIGSKPENIFVYDINDTVIPQGSGVFNVEIVDVVDNKYDVNGFYNHIDIIYSPKITNTSSTKITSNSSGFLANRYGLYGGYII